MQKTTSFVLIVLISGFFLGCASHHIQGEHIKTSGDVLTPKQKNDVIDVYFSDKKPVRPTTEIGRVSARAKLLEEGVDELRNQAREMGADAIINVTYERRMSADYFIDLYFFNGEAVVWK